MDPASASRLLAELEERKRLAVVAEDYDEAKRVKREQEAVLLRCGGEMAAARGARGTSPTHAAPAPGGGSPPAAARAASLLSGWPSQGRGQRTGAPAAVPRPDPPMSPPRPAAEEAQRPPLRPQPPPVQQPPPSLPPPPAPALSPHGGGAGGAEWGPVLRERARQRSLMATDAKLECDLARRRAGRSSEALAEAQQHLRRLEEHVQQQRSEVARLARAQSDREEELRAAERREAEACAAAEHAEREARAAPAPQQHGPRVPV
eukprot:TRINITY_DN56652_c0_g1_i1.p2 TRINITY_DN56652_c0_g1~~TRINITY_DN56652_c0_g1_i1.p2  ORF type:complete len:286 (+),score=84.04 TRINITY_DN56652_c0_g1_i1:73-858(+)